MLTPALQPVSLAIDPKGLGDLKRRALTDEDGALRAAAKQFETLMLDIMMKSMRSAAPGESLLDNEGTRMFTSLLDQEFSRKLADGGGLGLADLIVAQLTQLQRARSSETAVSADKATK